MRIDTGQHMRLGQQMKLAPRMIQSMEILQMSSQQLEERLEQELTSNPTLELKEQGTDPAQVSADLNQEQRDSKEGERDLVVSDDQSDPNHRDDFERLSNISEEIGDSWDANTYETGESFRPAPAQDRDAKLDAMANTAARPQSLTEQLFDQWRMIETTDTMRRAGAYLIEQIDADGYIRTAWQSIVNNAPTDLTAEILEEALTSLQATLEPIGMAARDLRECLLLQIAARRRQEGDVDDLSVQDLLVRDHLKDIEMNRLPQLAKSTGLMVDQINAAKRHLRQYHPHPGRLLVDDAPRAITPDAIVEYDEEEDHYVATLTGGRVPGIQINRRYLQMSRNREIDRRTKEFVGQNLQRARWLLDAIEQRSSTLLRVINVVIEHQRTFFDEGPQALRPLPMTMVADQLGIHVATVSRAVNEKYLQTPRGIFPLRMYFSGGTETEDGASMSWSAVQAKLKTIIDGEDKQHPLNDDQLVEALKADGIDIARRTVAKYRKQLSIPPARQRREY